MADSEQNRTHGGAHDPFEMFRRLWAPLGLPVPGMAMPTLDPAEVDKRIADLKSVETWLGMNLNMVKMAIQGLEVQKMALTAMQANAGAASDAANAFAKFAASGVAPGNAAEKAANTASGSGADPAHPGDNPMLWPWAMMQGAAMSGATTDKPADGAAAKPGKPKPPESRQPKEKK